MKILALEPYYGGSHRAFLDGWSKRSVHAWTILGLPPYKWKWRMRHAAITFAEMVKERINQGEMWDVVFCSDMLNLAEFKGLVTEPVQALPAVAYFHENQLTYPVRHETERDYHFSLTNITTCLSASRVWFNSEYHRRSFLEAVPVFFNKMPDHQPDNAVGSIQSRSSIQPPGIEGFPPRKERKPGPVRLLWAARWEHDKDPDTFFNALDILKKQDTDFRVSAIGEQFREVPPVFAESKKRFGENIDCWGFQETREQYRTALSEADIIVSAAQHEFFGISIVEAVAAGAFPVVPDRLAYPDILNKAENGDFFYEGSVKALAEKLAQLAERLENGSVWLGNPDQGREIVSRFLWDRLVLEMDGKLEALRNAK